MYLLNLGILLLALLANPLNGTDINKTQEATINPSLSQDNYNLETQCMTHNKKNIQELAERIQHRIELKENKKDISPKKTQSIDDFFDELFISEIAHDPQRLSYLGLLNILPIRSHNAHLTDISPQALRTLLEEKKKNLALLKTYDYQQLSTEQKLSYDIIAWMLNYEINGEKFLFHHYKINQLDSVLIDILELFTQFHVLETAHDFELYNVRLSKIAEQFKQITEYMEIQKEQGITLPRFTIEKVIKNIASFIQNNPTQNPLYTHYAQKLKTLNINNDILLKNTTAILHDSVYPAYQALYNYFTQMLSSVQTNNGVWALPHGDEYYAYMLKGETTTDLSPEGIHALGLTEVATIQKNMRALLAQEGISDPNKSIGILMQELSQNPSLHYPNTPEGRKECLEKYHAILERSRTQLGHLFTIKPSAGVTIKQVPLEQEEGSTAAYYYAPSLDGSRPGIFFANLRNMAEIPQYGMETLTIHEAEPGHHFQLALQREMALPLLRKTARFTAYIEGWALYTEKLAYEHNFYSSSFSQLGHLQDELLRAVRLVVDTGIHYYRWTREQAIEYMQNVTGYHYDSVVSEVERYFVLPGQACSYKIGQLKILELRQRAQEKLGNLFDIREFHTVILKTAAAPLSILEDIVDAYITEKISSPES